jgi:hypothetical protein
MNEFQEAEPFLGSKQSPATEKGNLSLLWNLKILHQTQENPYRLHAMINAKKRLYTKFSKFDQEKERA